MFTCDVCTNFLLQDSHLKCFYLHVQWKYENSTVSFEPHLKISIQQEFFFAPKNRNTVVNKIFKNLTSAKKADIELFMEQANVILTVTNSLGKIKIKPFETYIKKAHVHWMNAK